jgi:alanine-glyoxylate transaminase/serine-glyoxylate transaminase/serine-pyruvate transaminase
VHPDILEALARPTLGHLDPAYLEIMDEIQGMLRQLFGTKNPLTFSVSGTGTAGMETVLTNLLEPGDRALVCVHGYFGDRMAQIAERAGASVIRLERPWGEAFEVGEIEAAVEHHRPKVVAVVLAETSTGVLQPLEGWGEIVHRHGGLLVVDAVTALGCVPVPVDDWGIDAIYSCSQKGLGCPSGLSPVSFSPRAVAVAAERKTPARSWYLDLNLLARYWDEGKSARVYHHTAPSNLHYALHEGARRLLAEGLEAVHGRHRRNHRALAAGLAALGMGYTASPAIRLPQLNAVEVPGGVEEGVVRGRLLERFGIEIGGGLGVFAGKVWRIGLMGHGSREANVLLLLAALEQLLAEAGHSFAAGAGVAAANAVYRKDLQGE